MYLAIRLTSVSGMIRKRIEEEFEIKRGGLILPEVSQLQRGILYRIPESIPETNQILIFCEEWGGWNTKTGDKKVQLVTTVNGKRITPLPSRDRVVPCEEQAKFSLPYERIIRIYVDAIERTARIDQLKVVRSGREVCLERFVLWEGNSFDNLSYRVSHMRVAFSEALKKTECPNCTHVHFAKRE